MCGKFKRHDFKDGLDPFCCGLSSRAQQFPVSNNSGVSGFLSHVLNYGGYCKMDFLPVKRSIALQARYFTSSLSSLPRCFQLAMVANLQRKKERTQNGSTIHNLDAQADALCGQTYLVRFDRRSKQLQRLSACSRMPFAAVPNGR
jgi:hypothetical protein